MADATSANLQTKKRSPETDVSGNTKKQKSSKKGLEFDETISRITAMENAVIKAKMDSVVHMCGGKLQEVFQSHR